MLVEVMITEEPGWTLVEIPTLKIVTGCEATEDVEEYILDAVKLCLESDDVEVIWPDRDEKPLVKIVDDITLCKFVLRQHGHDSL